MCLAKLALEGAISKVSARATLAAGSAPSGDLIPWTISGQFQDDAFPGLTGARIVRIAVHPDLRARIRHQSSGVITRILRRKTNRYA